MTTADSEHLSHHDMYSVATDVARKTEVVSALSARIASVVDDFRASDIWSAVSDTGTPRGVVAAILREIYFEVCCYQPLTTKAGFLMIGSIEASERKVMKSLLLHKWDEVEHVQWAERGFLALGGDPSRLERASQHPTPQAFAVAAVWDRLATQVHPLAYIGAEYLFESLTAEITKFALPALERAGLGGDGLYFVSEHATEDIKHTNLLGYLADDVCARRPELVEPMLYAFDCFRAVYPMPIWMEAYRRAVAGRVANGGKA